MMDFTEEMIEKVAMDLHGKPGFRLAKKEIDFKRPFKRITMLDSIEGTYWCGYFQNERRRNS
jgi:lysyl-tRNA synthetase class 2